MNTQFISVLIDEAENVCYTSLTNADVNTWQPYQPGDSLCSPLVHKVKSDLKIPADLSKGTYRLGLWIPDGSERLKYDNRFAIRCANGNVGWWISKDKNMGLIYYRKLYYEILLYTNSLIHIVFFFRLQQP